MYLRHFDRKTYIYWQPHIRKQMDRKRHEIPQRQMKSEVMRDTVSEVISVDDYDEKMKLLEVQDDIKSFRDDVTKRISQVENQLVSVGQQMMKEFAEVSN